MGLASIMVHVGVGSDTQGRVDIARSLATRFNARLIGITGQAPPPMASGDIMGEIEHRIGGDIVELDEIEQPDTTTIVKRLVALANAFRDNAEPNLNVTFRSAVEQPTALIVREARAADLVILGRRAASDIADRAVDPASVLLRCGRPVLMVPDAIGTLSAERIVVGWKETREACRAVRDALALLKGSKEVTIVAVEEPTRSAADSRALDDVAAYLAQHGVLIGDTITHAITAHVGAALWAIASEKGADLIVAGGYGHSRLSEWVYGGVTREPLYSGPTCCLLSH
jgi:nucleotide-binding universal stress UspA family protein